MLEPGWLEKEFARTAEAVKYWPDWMKREAGLQVTHEEQLSEDGAGRRGESATRETRAGDKPSEGEAVQ